MDDAALRRRRVFREAAPGTAGEFADIDVALAVDGDAVRRGELARCDAGMRLAEARQDLVAFGAMHADSRPDIRPIAVDLARRSALADIAKRVRSAREAHAVRAMQIIPLRFPLAVTVEDLHPVVLAVRDIDPAVRIAADVVRNIELPRIGAGLAPRGEQLAVQRKFVDAGVAIAVRDVEAVAVWRQGGMGAAVERLASQEWGRLARNAECHQHAAIERAVAHGMVAVIGQPDRVVRRDMHAVRPGEQALAPGAQQVAVLVKHSDRVLAAVEGVDILLAVDPDRGAIPEHDLVRDLRPAFLDLEAPLAATEPHRHPVLPLFTRGL